MKMQNKEVSDTKRSSAMNSQKDENMLIDSLNGLLANQYVVFTKTLNYHWNLIGLQFYSIHTLLGTQYQELLQMMDELAERIRFLGGQPVGTVKGLSETATLSEKGGPVPDIVHILTSLSQSHEGIDEEIQGIYDIESLKRDRVSEDLMINLQKRHQKIIWIE